MDEAQQSNDPRKFLREAVFSDGTEWFRIPPEPRCNETVKIIIRTGKNNADAVVLIAGLKQYLMKKTSHDDFFDYYMREIRIEDHKISYYFLIECDGQYYYYSYNFV